MKCVSDSEDIRKFLLGREYLTSDEHQWIDGKNQVFAMTSMDASYQLNCMRWMVKNLQDLKLEDEDVVKAVKPLVIEKMKEFKDVFKLALKKVQTPLKGRYKKDFNDVKTAFDFHLKELKKI